MAKVMNWLSFLVVAFTLSIFIQGVESASLPFPSWPADFRWSNNGPLNNFRCVQISEPSDPHGWNNNYFCSSNAKADPGMQWSAAGPIGGMTCTQIIESVDPHTWSDNFLCVPNNSPLQFSWGSAGPDPTKACIQWLESADPNSWFDNYLCAPPS